MRRPAQRPLRGRELVGGQRCSSLDESFVIERQATGEPLRARLRPGHSEDVPDLFFLHRSASTRTPGDLFEMSVAFQTYDLRPWVQLDLWMCFDPAYQVARHGFCETVATNEHVHALRGLREEHGRLARGVGAAHDGDLFVSAELRFHTGGGVVYAGALEARQILDREAPILDPARDDDGAGEQRIAGGRTALYAVWLRAAVEPGDLPRDEDLRAKLLRLIVCAACQLLAGDAEREAEVVLDARARSRLTAGRVPFDHHDVQ